MVEKPTDKTSCDPLSLVAPLIQHHSLVHYVPPSRVCPIFSANLQKYVHNDGH